MYLKYRVTSHIAEDTNMAIIKLERERRKHPEAQWLMVKWANHTGPSQWRVDREQREKHIPNCEVNYESLVG